MRDVVKRRSFGNGDHPTNKKMKEEPMERKPDLRKVKEEVEDGELIEVIGERRIPSILEMNTHSHTGNHGRVVPPPPIVDRLMLVPRECAGLVIGKKGANLAQLRAAFPSVFIVLDTMSGRETALPCPLYARGTREQTSAVIEWVSEKIGYFSPIYQSAPINNHYFKEVTVPRDAIYSIDKSKLEKEDQVVMIFSEEEGAPTRSILITGNQLNVNGAVSRVEGMMKYCPDGVMTWRMRVPHYSVGRVIGARHANIIETRKKSGARVELLNPKEGEDPLYRYFEMTGTREQIATADKMIREFSGQYLDGSFLQTSHDSGFSSNPQSPRSLNNSLSLPLPRPLPHYTPAPLPPPRKTPRFWG